MNHVPLPLPTLTATMDSMFGAKDTPPPGELLLVAGATIDAELWGFALESALFGIFLVLQVYALAILADPGRTKSGFVPHSVNRGMLAGAILLFSLLTAHWATGAYRIQQAIKQAGMGPFGAALYFGKQGDNVTVARQAIIFVSGWILDCVLVYRVYILFGNSKLIALMPGIFLVGTMASGIATLHWLTTLTFSLQVYETDIYTWVAITFSLTLVTNLLCAGLVIYKTAKIHRALKFWGGSRALLPVVLIIIESAALYAVVALVMLVGFLVQHPVVSFASDVMSPIIGISFASIIVRVAHAHPKPFLPSNLPPISPAFGHSGLLPLPPNRRPSHSSDDLPSHYPSAADDFNPMPWGRRDSTPWMDPLPLGGPDGMGRRASAPAIWYNEPIPVGLGIGPGWFTTGPGGRGQGHVGHGHGLPGAGDSASALLPRRRESLAPLTPIAPPPPVALRFPPADVRIRSRTRSTATAVSGGDHDPDHDQDCDDSLKSLKTPDSPRSLVSEHRRNRGDDVPMKVFIQSGT